MATETEMITEYPQLFAMSWQDGEHSLCVRSNPTACHPTGKVTELCTIVDAPPDIRETLDEIAKRWNAYPKLTAAIRNAMSPALCKALLNKIEEGEV